MSLKAVQAPGARPRFAQAGKINAAEHLSHTWETHWLCSPRFGSALSSKSSLTWGRRGKARLPGLRCLTFHSELLSPTWNGRVEQTCTSLLRPRWPPARAAAFRKQPLVPLVPIPLYPASLERHSNILDGAPSPNSPNASYKNRSRPRRPMWRR